MYVCIVCMYDTDSFVLSNQQILWLKLLIISVERCHEIRTELSEFSRCSAERR